MSSKEVDVRPTIAITKAHIQMLELVEAIDKGRLVADGKILNKDGSCVVTKAAIEHVWHLPGKLESFCQMQAGKPKLTSKQEWPRDSVFLRLLFAVACSSKLEACSLNW